MTPPEVLQDAWPHNVDMTEDLFADQPGDEAARVVVAPGAVLLRAFACDAEDALLGALHAVMAAAPPQILKTPGGQAMSVAITHCGRLGWWTDRRGYRYEPASPTTSEPWPAMPDCFAALARRAAAEAGFDAFEPDACLINRYVPGARMSLHQDKDEKDFTAPIVSVSLGLPAVFLWGGLQRSDRAQRIPLHHGDVVVWGGLSRLVYHGVAPLAVGHHPLLGPQRINLTFRRAG